VPTIKINSRSVDVDLRAELETYTWTRPKWTDGKLIAASPFRYDQTPSFFVNLEHGGWSDSGAYDAEWASGGFVKLLAFLRNETTEETEDYLIGEYAVDYVGDELPKLRPNLNVKNSSPIVLSADHLANFTEDYSYLLRRGISVDVQRTAGIRYDIRQRAVIIPWHDSQNRLRNVKYRTTYGKTFWYYKGATPIRELVYGIDSIDLPEAVLCEAEIDALSWRMAGFQAIAVGGASFNEVKRDIILRSPIEELIIATDNDKAGGKLRLEIERYFKGHIRVRQAYVCGGAVVGEFSAKDANEALVKYGATALVEAVAKSTSMRKFYVM
jgi:5S rRNA maturation endonuclease (ribonuclease M5)